MISALVCDWGGVLSTPLGDAFGVVRDELGIPLDELNAAITAYGESLGANPLHELECGRLSEADFLAGVESALGVDFSRFSEVYWAALGVNEVMVGEVAALRASGLHTALLTNNVREWAPRWRAGFDVDALFEVVVDSCEVGMRKPDPAVYELACARLGVSPSACVFVDDFEVNCATARSLGMTAVRFETTDQALRDLRAALGRD